jgi:heterodisulfide reductase subunit B
MESGPAPSNHPPGECRLRYAYTCDTGEPAPPGDEATGERVREALAALGLSLEELGEPAGCAASGPGMNGIAAYAKVARLLGLAAGRLALLPDSGGTPTVVTPCAACARSLSRAAESLATHVELRDAVADELASDGLPFHPGAVRVRHLLDVLGEDVGIPAVRARVRRPLAGLRVAPFEGCLRSAGGADEAGSRSALGELLEALGAEVVEFPLRSHCCGGRAAEASEETATSLHVRLHRSAAEAGAEVVATACTRCARNLSGWRDAVNRRFGTRFAIPVVHFTALLADAVAADGVRS